MADLTRLIIHEEEIQFLAGPTGALGRHIQGLADRVENQAILNASNVILNIRTGDLIEETRQQPGVDDQGYFIDIGSTAEHRRYPYPSRLETGADGVEKPWLRPALEEVFRNA